MTEPDRALPEESPRPPTQGFQMSGKRAAIEIALLLGIVGSVILGVLWFARYGAERFTGLVPLEVDRTIGEQNARVLSVTSSVCTDPAPKKYVDAVVAPLLAALDDHRFHFEFVVVDDPEVNAFALPGGFVTVNKGLLDSAESGDEVAAVLAHELQHVLRRHGTQRMLRELGASTLLSALFGGTDIAVPAKATHDFVSNAYDRGQESEADEKGLALLVKAGLDPRGMSRFFDRLAKTGLAPPALLSTHPDPGDRAEKAAHAAQTMQGGRAATSLPSPRGMKCRP
jgi:predicted Zn-dependent protease